ncbi:hypothetical protein HKW97_23260 (plasmid) [Pseudomonas luteola]|uniref:hypothetical protein n=1 Tax=Pseudomonas luteola TaxID=47886 RepID=UPI00388EE851
MILISSSAGGFNGLHWLLAKLPPYLKAGVLGMEAAKCHGWITLAQDPLEAVSPFMVNNRLDHTYVDYWLPVNQLAEKLVSLTHEAVEQSQQDVDWLATEDQVSKQRSSGIPGLEATGAPSPFGYPECRGVLYEIKQNGQFHYRCHTGHSYSAEMLSKSQEWLAEEAMRTATRVYDEKEALHLRLAEQAQKNGPLKSYELHRREAGKARQCSARLREMIRLHMA